ncbi:MAG: hypothetical protein J3K34DRAFT_63065 [Monoraphidium minutum]|nr:MAG: hypothetical protein J3K34DRAFT_63065 [Monoraphidium minutum]
MRLLRVGTKMKRAVIKSCVVPRLAPFKIVECRFSAVSPCLGSAAGRRAPPGGPGAGGRPSAGECGSKAWRARNEPSGRRWGSQKRRAAANKVCGNGGRRASGRGAAGAKGGGMPARASPPRCFNRCDSRRDVSPLQEGARASGGAPDWRPSASPGGCGARAPPDNGLAGVRGKSVPPSATGGRRRTRGVRGRGHG